MEIGVGELACLPGASIHMSAASWSGGKESSLACYKAISEGLTVSHLLNLVSTDGRCMSHGLNSKLIAAQSRAIEIPLVQRNVTWSTYEREFKTALHELKRAGVDSVVFGDIDVQEHKDWIDRVCGEVGMRPVMPLWGGSSESIMADFIAQGFEAILVSAKASLLNREWLGRRIDEDFVADLLKLRQKSDIHISGELGEYHTFVTDGPLFKRRLRVLDADRIRMKEQWVLDILEFEIVEK